jgi:8-oxo-dGTP pyrophosphatase MutT (NUDIX family)
VTDPVRTLQARVLAQARLAPAPDALALVIARQSCGSVAPALARALDGRIDGLRVHDGLLELDDAGLDQAARSQRLQALAQFLIDTGHAPGWRHEDLEVRADPDAPALACIDRSAVRVLGITTYSVHLNGWTADGRLVVAQRATHKRVDPNYWDNLAGGMIAAGESVRTALAREACEEAGVDVDAMVVHAGARIAVRRPIPEGVLAEVVNVFDVELPAGTQPQNQDGEVARFEVRTVPAVLVAIEHGEFTVEAALATLDSLARRGWRG